MTSENDIESWNERADRFCEAWSSDVVVSYPFHFSYGRRAAVCRSSSTFRQHLIMGNRRSDLISALVVGLLAGVGFAAVDFAIDCRAPSSEACFWAKHLFPLSLGLSIVIVGGVVAVLIYVGLLWRRRRQSKDDSV